MKKVAKCNIVKKKAMIEALEKSLGVVTSACKVVDIARKTHYEWYNTDEDYKKAVDEVANIALDFAETALHRQINEGNTAATIFLLKCKGKERGYVEKQEVEHSGEVTNKNIQIVFKDDVDDNDIGFTDT